ncbi:MAG: toxin-antitoxin system protein [Selenomonadaceae bacterium]|nr:toxin-antitoxin system protein [Selenomonadaceae bacterium]
MSALRQNAMMMVQSLPENQLLFIVNIMKELSRLIPADDNDDLRQVTARDKAFDFLEGMHRKIPDLDYDKELTEYRKEKYL